MTDADRSDAFSCAVPTRLLALASTSAREAVRERIVLVFLLFALLLMGAAWGLGEISVGQERRIILNLGWSAIRFFGLLMALFLGIRLVHQEIARRTILLLLAKPVARWEILVGKFLGGAFVLLGSVALMIGGLVLILVIATGTWREESASWSAAAWSVWLQLLLAEALAFFFSTFSTPLVIGIVTLSLLLAGYAAHDFWMWAESARSPAIALLARALYYVLPNVSRLDLVSEVVHRRAISAGDVGMASIYAFLYAGVVLAAAALIFERRSFR